MSEKTATGTGRKGRWSIAEDLKLTEYVNLNGPRNWKGVAEYVKTRNSKQCRERWDGHLRPGISPDPFDRKEELEIIRLREVEECRWRDIARKIGNHRTPNAIKNIYIQKLSKRSFGQFKMQNHKNPTRGFNNSTRLKSSDVATNKESRPHPKMSIVFITTQQ